MFECERCKLKSYDYLDTVMLTGEYYCQLCLHCRNEWSDYADAHPLGERYREHRANIEQCKILAHTQHNCGEWIKSLLLELWQIEREFRVVAREWVAAGVKEKA